MRFLASLRHAALLAIILIALVPAASAGDDEWTSIDASGGRVVHLHFFWSLHCPHCLEARPQIQALAAEHPWLRLHDFEITQSTANRERFVAMAGQLGEQAQAVPTLFYCGRMRVGWDDSPEARSALLAELARCRQSGAAGTPATEAPRPIRLPLLGEIDPAALSLPAMTVVLAALDAFNPCAFFVLLFLLSLLVHQRRRTRMLVIGGVFVAVSGLMYFAFMAAWLNLFLVLGGLPWITAAAGVLALVIAAVNIKDFIIFRKGISLSIPESRKADIFQRSRRILNADSLPAMLAATVLLAVAANFYELLCTAGFPMVFTHLLTLQVHDPARHYLYLALYNLIYVLPLLLIVLAFVRSMGARKLSEREGRLLKLLSGLMMAGLGIFLVAAPEMLASPGVGLGLLAGAGALAWLAARLTQE
ncbi:thioredoxin family protein [Dechloromonas sp. H13]|uniref:TlpA family protein disulfide reductase n=1 Tax=Dechloromonas sp. H13 TaxID=2570193 RepID=UPI001291A7F6|nr:thioredoxin family protein [Dechloromonas sp. H13]